MEFWACDIGDNHKVFGVIEDNVVEEVSNERVMVDWGGGGEASRWWKPGGGALR